VGEELECAATEIDPKADAEKMEGKTPSLDAQPLMKMDSANAIQCIRCGLESVYVDGKANGRYSMRTTLLIDKNGLVKEVEIEKPPSPTLEESIRRSILQWVFLPVQKDGVPVNVKLNTSVNVTVVRPR
jgi:TonB-like protein